MSFAGKTAAVTGAAGGMGLNIARDLAAAGASVTGIDLQPRPDGFAGWTQGDVGDEALSPVRWPKLFGATAASIFWSMPRAFSGSTGTARCSISS